MSRTMRLAVKPFGVLGTTLKKSGVVQKVAQGPVPGWPIVDPAGLSYIRAGPKGAGGAAGEIYRWLDIAEQDAFPAPVSDATTAPMCVACACTLCMRLRMQVRAAITAPRQAKLHYYGTKACLHVVGPDFCGRSCSREQRLLTQSIATCRSHAHGHNHATPTSPQRRSTSCIPQCLRALTSTTTVPAGAVRRRASAVGADGGVRGDAG